MNDIESQARAKSAAQLPAPSTDEALSFRAVLPVVWTPLLEVPDAATMDAYHEENLRTLSIVSLLNEQRSSVGANDDANSIEGEVARLNQKMNLLSDLMATLVSHLIPAPAPVPTHLSSVGLRWQAPAAGAFGMVSLRLHASVPQPFQWTAQHHSIEDGWQQAVFEPMAEACRAALERYVFLHHRRAIALHRRPAIRC